MKPGQLYLDTHFDPPAWDIILITDIENGEDLIVWDGTGRPYGASYQMVGYEIIAWSKNRHVNSCGRRAFATTSVMASYLIPIDKKDLPLYLDGNTTPKFEQILKGEITCTSSI